MAGCVGGAAPGLDSDTESRPYLDVRFKLSIDAEHRSQRDATRAVLFDQPFLLVSARDALTDLDCIRSLKRSSGAWFVLVQIKLSDFYIGNGIFTAVRQSTRCRIWQEAISLAPSILTRYIHVTDDQDQFQT